MTPPVLPLESGIVYGPVVSRRLGLSLGVNVLPTEAKVCSFDCLYCHYGATGIRTRRQGAEGTSAPDAVSRGNVSFPTVEAVLRAVERGLRRYPEVTTITFSGNGEPTLHPYFHTLAFELRQLRDRLNVRARMALFSNGAHAVDPQIRGALAYIDLPILKLDAGNETLFELVNRPAPGIAFDAVVAGLKEIEHLVIQTVLIDGALSNTGEGAIADWLEILAVIRPTAVQIYSTDYPVAESDVRRVPAYVLRRLAEKAERHLGVPVRAYWVT